MSKLLLLLLLFPATNERERLWCPAPTATLTPPRTCRVPSGLRWRLSSVADSGQASAGQPAAAAPALQQRECCTARCRRCSCCSFCGAASAAAAAWTAAFAACLLLMLLLGLLMWQHVFLPWRVCLLCCRRLLNRLTAAAAVNTRARELLMLRPLLLLFQCAWACCLSCC